VEIPGIGEKMVEKIHQSVKSYFEALEAQESGVAIEPVGEDAAIVEEAVELDESSDSGEAGAEPADAGEETSTVENAAAGEGETETVAETASETGPETTEAPDEVPPPEETETEGDKK